MHRPSHRSWPVYHTDWEYDERLIALQRVDEILTYLG